MRATKGQALFTFPQSVGIAGGRPSSSYYFVAYQANSLFYLDPHLTRPAVPLRTPPASASRTNQIPTKPEHSPRAAQVPDGPSQPEVSNDDLNTMDPMARSDLSVVEDAIVVDPSEAPSYTLGVVNVDDLSDGEDSDSAQLSATRPEDAAETALHRTPSAEQSTQTIEQSILRKTTDSGQIDVFGATGPTQTGTRTGSPDVAMHFEASQDLTAAAHWYAEAYPDAQLRTFHCERVKKMPMSGLDPSMLLGFLVQDEADFEDFCDRVAKVSLGAVYLTWLTFSFRRRSSLCRTSPRRGTTILTQVSNRYLSRILTTVTVWATRRSHWMTP